MSHTATFDPDRVIFIWNGIPFEGFGTGTFIAISRNVDGVNLVVGARGEGARGRSGNKSGRATFNLLNTSTSNGVVTAALHADENRIPGGIGSLLVIDKSSKGTLASAESAWFVKHANQDYEENPNNREYILETNNLFMASVGH